MDLQVFWNVATLQTLASLIVDIDDAQFIDDGEDDEQNAALRLLVMEQLVAIVGEEEAIDLISSADARR